GHGASPAVTRWLVGSPGGRSPHGLVATIAVPLGHLGNCQAAPPFDGGARSDPPLGPLHGIYGHLRGRLVVLPQPRPGSIGGRPWREAARGDVRAPVAPLGLG